MDSTAHSHKSRERFLLLNIPGPSNTYSCYSDHECSQERTVFSEAERVEINIRVESETKTVNEQGSLSVKIVSFLNSAKELQDHKLPAYLDHALALL